MCEESSMEEIAESLAASSSTLLVAGTGPITHQVKCLHVLQLTTCISCNVVTTQFVVQQQGID